MLRVLIKLIIIATTARPRTLEANWRFSQTASFLHFWVRRLDMSPVIGNSNTDLKVSKEDGIRARPAHEQS